MSAFSKLANDYIPDDIRWGDIDFDIVLDLEEDGNETLESVYFNLKNNE